MSYFIKQIGTKDCSMACLKMLLAIVYHSKKFLYYPQTAKDNAYSLKDIVKIADQEGVTLEGFKYNNPESIFKSTRFPILAITKSNANLHMILIKKITRKKVLIYDPKIGIYYMKKEEFLAVWTSETLEIKNVKGSLYKDSSKSPIPVKYRILSTIFQISSMVSLLAAMFFISPTYPFIVPLLLLTAFALSEITYKRILVDTMKYFDRSYFPKIYCGDKKIFRERFIDLNRYKTEVIGLPIQLINAIVVVCAGLLILGLNSYINVINVTFIIIIRLLIDLIEHKYFMPKCRNVEASEFELFEEDNEGKYLNKIEELQNNTYRRVDFMNVKKYITVFLTIAICLLYSSVMDGIAVNFILFHVFAYYYIVENASKLLDLSLKSSDYRYSKCLFKYYSQSF